jgi:hypothetical protein
MLKQISARGCFALAVALSAGSFSAAPHAQVDVVVAGNIATATITLPGPMSATQYQATLTLQFDSPENLTAENLGISAVVVDPLDPALAARFPAGAMASIPAAFPVLITVEPPFGAARAYRASYEDDDDDDQETSELAFRNTVLLDLVTNNLTFVAPSPVRMYRAPLGGTFEDITIDVLSGSVRTRARSSEFSEFLLLDDLRPDAVAATSQYDEIEARLLDNDVPPMLRSQLQLELGQSRARFALADFGGARSELAEFVTLAVDASGVSLINRWRAGGDLDNIGGDLVAEAANLDFYLARLEDD